jgi:hypothetical protein
MVAIFTLLLSRSALNPEQQEIAILSYFANNDELDHIFDGHRTFLVAVGFCLIFFIFPSFIN